jgi:hypothetical protein
MRIDWILLNGLTRDTAQVGDLVSADAGGMPTYRILELDGDVARLRDEAHACEEISPLSRFRWRACPPAS